MTLDEDNLLWLRARVGAERRRGLSDLLDEIVTQARTSAREGREIRSVVGTVDIAADDPLLSAADAMVRGVFEASLGGASLVNDAPPRRGRSGRRRG